MDWIKAKPGKATAIGAGVVAAATAAVALPILLSKSKNSKTPQKAKGENPLGDLKNDDKLGILKVGNGENEVVIEENNKNNKNQEENPNYKKFDWENARFSSNDDKGEKKVIEVTFKESYLNDLKEKYSIERDFTAKYIGDVYHKNGYIHGSRFNLIIIDCDCEKFYQEGPVRDKKGNLTAYCNGHGQIFILENNSSGEFLNYGEKNVGKWTIKEVEEGSNNYYVYWHTF